MTEEFSRRVDVQIFKDEPQTREQWLRRNPLFNDFDGQDPEDVAMADTAYRHYQKRFQPYTWHAKGMNGEIVASGERYLNLVGVMNAIELNYGDDTTAYMVQMFGEDRGDKWLRYGRTDRVNQRGLANTVIVGDEAFATEDGSVLCWRGVNYVPQEPS